MNRREIDCLQRLQQLNGSFDDIVDFLTQEALVDKELIKSLKMSPEAHKAIHNLLRKLSAEGRLQLCEYEWAILPVERIKLTVVTEKSTREFAYNF